MLLLSMPILLQTATPGLTSGAGPVDPGNDPIFTTFFYFIFLIILIGSGIVGFRLRQRRMRQEKEKSDGR